MKKLLSAAIATAMVAGLTVPAFAATEIESPSKNNGAGDYSIGVNGKFEAGTAAEEQFSVDIAWESMNFTYKAGSSSYDAGTHTTTTTAGTWSTNKPGITVTNHSNTEVTAAFAFTQAEGVTTTGTFYTKDGDDYTKAETDAAKKLMLDSAEGTTRNDTDGTADKSPKDTIYFGVSGDPITENKTLGTITVTLATPVWTVVTDEEGLKTALAAGGYIKLGDNMTSDTAIQLSNETATKTKVKLDLNGKTLTAQVVLSGKYDVTVLDKTGTGTITSDGETIVLSNGATFTLESGTVNSNNSKAISANNGNVTINGGKVAGRTAERVFYGEYAGIYCEGSNLTVTGGEIIGGTAIFTNNGTTNISGGTITGKITTGSEVYALAQSGGTLTISGGTFDAMINSGGDVRSRYSLYVNTEATIKGGTFKQSIDTPGTMTIDDCTMSGNAIVNYAATETAELTINGGTYTNVTSFSNHSLVSGKTAKLNINGGPFTLSASIDNMQINGTAITTINNANITANGINNDGTMTVSNSTLSISGHVTNNGTLTLTTGTYNFNPSDYVDTANYTVTDNGDGTWTVTANAAN